MTLHTTGEDFVFECELLHNLTGSGPIEELVPVVWVVKPGTDAAELIVAEIEAVSDNTYSVTVPGTYLEESGVYAFMAAVDNFSSAEVQLLQVGSSHPVGQELWVPFYARKTTGAAELNTDHGDLTLSVILGDAVDRTVPVDGFRNLSTPSLKAPICQVRVLASEIAGNGRMVYSIAGPGLRTFSRTIAVGSDELLEIELYLVPAQYRVGMSIAGADGSIAQVVYTDSGGVARTLLAPGTYTATLSRQNWVFSENNVEFTIEADTTEVQFNGAYTLPAGASTGFCAISFRLLDATGSPLVGQRVLFAPTASVVANSAITNKALSVETDSQGYGRINLIQGMRVTVNVEGTRVYEEFTVPATASADLFDDNLISFAEKVFDTYLADFDSAIRRTLEP